MRTAFVNSEHKRGKKASVSVAGRTWFANNEYGPRPADKPGGGGPGNCVDGFMLGGKWL